MSPKLHIVQATQRRAALYLRMSTDRQKYSIENQSCALYAYAVEHDIEVVEQFCDEAKSGLTFEGRPAMRRLIEQVKSGQCGFNSILTYDVSRWGRYQDADESAYYEHLCRQAGIEVIYCAEGFDAYEGPISFVLKSLKRTMAAEYSRDLSQKVTDARWRMAKAGLHTGSRPRIGLCRAVVNKDGVVEGTVEDGCCRHHPGDQLMIRPGPRHEQVVVQRIFRQYAELRLSIPAIVKGLNDDPAARVNGRCWTFSMVRMILIDERYIGNLVFRSFHQTGQIKRAKMPTRIIRHEGVFDPIVPLSLYQAAAKRLSQTWKAWDKASLLDSLKEVYAENGKVTTQILNSRCGGPSSTTYAKHFGSLVNAYLAAGIQPTKDCSWVARRAANNSDRKKMMNDVAATLMAQGHSVQMNYKECILDVDASWGIHIKLVRAKRLKTGFVRWMFELVDAHRTDLLLLLRLDQTGSHVEDMYLVPTLSIRRTPDHVVLGRVNNLGTEMYRIGAFSEIPPLANRYLADVEDCMAHFGRTQQDVDKRFSRRRAKQPDPALEPSEAARTKEARRINRIRSQAGGKVRRASHPQLSATPPVPRTDDVRHGSKANIPRI
ncbi:recombinase family protein [Dyella japonica]|uniref:recombinase family protein n=1 Tax=Dyella japonica TaxID=231455 RepID=UPI00130DFCF6|nr:recombinase family protein [Dyella japonica]